MDAWFALISDPESDPMTWDKLIHTDRKIAEAWLVGAAGDLRLPHADAFVFRDLDEHTGVETTYTLMPIEVHTSAPARHL